MSLNSGVDLGNRLRVFRGELYNHDYLWFSSTEISTVSTTLPYLHNYALCYALSQYERGVAFGSTPTYDADLENMPLYTTPAVSGAFVETTKLRFNAVDAKTLKTDHRLNVNAPKLGQRTYLNPIFAAKSSAKSTVAYLFYLFSYNGDHPRSVMRLGKKGCPVRIEWEEMRRPSAVWSQTPVRPSHPVNPLDVTGTITRFDPVMLPPHLLLRVADIQHDWFIRQGRHNVHVPKRVAARVGLTEAGGTK